VNVARGKDRGLLLNKRYRVESMPSGSGGMGQVYFGTDEKLRRPVAVKMVLLRGDAQDDDLVHRFVRESRLTARLVHPGVPAIHDVGLHGDRPFLVMERIEGTTTAGLVAGRCPLPIGWTTGIAAQVCAVLAAAHDRGIVHRDLKPANIMVRPDGCVTVLDFGLAAAVGLPDCFTITRADQGMPGTVPYMAPELFDTGSRERGTPASDLYALGCTLFELLTGKRLFDGDSAFAVMRAQIEQEPPQVSQVLSELSYGTSLPAPVPCAGQGGRQRGAGGPGAGGAGAGAPAGAGGPGLPGGTGEAAGTHGRDRHHRTLPADLDDLVARLLRKSPDARPSCAAEVFEALLPHVSPEDPPAALGAVSRSPGATARGSLPAGPGNDAGARARGVSEGGPGTGYERSVAVGGYAAAVTALTRPSPDPHPVTTDGSTGGPRSPSAEVPSSSSRVPSSPGARTPAGPGPIAPDTPPAPATGPAAVVGVPAAPDGTSHGSDAHRTRAQIELLDKLFDAGCFDAAAAGYRLLGEELRATGDRGATAPAFECRRREAECLALLGRTGQAIRLVDELLIDCTGRWGPDDDRSLELRHRVALLRRGTGQGRQARGELADLVDDLRRLRGEEHRLTRRVLEDLWRAGS